MRYSTLHCNIGFGGLVTSNSCDAMDCSLPGCSVHGILQARILESVAISFSKIGFMFANWRLMLGLTGDASDKELA